MISVNAHLRRKRPGSHHCPAAPRSLSPHPQACCHRKLHLKRQVHPNLHAALLPRARPQKQPGGKATQAWTTRCGTNTRGKGTAIRKGGKHATGSDQEGPSEDPRKPSRSARGRPVSHHVPSRRKLKIQSHRLTEKTPTHTLETQWDF